jgi:hypothetical protein
LKKKDELILRRGFERALEVKYCFGRPRWEGRERGGGVGKAGGVSDRLVLCKMRIPVNASERY